MNRKLLIFIIIGIVLISGCVQISEKTKLTYSVGGCEVESQVRGTVEKSWYAKDLDLFAKENNLTLKHKLRYVCCAQLKIEWKKDGNMINITEVNEGEMCKCICTYDINASIGPLAKGTYIVKVYGVKYKDVEADLLIEKEIEIVREIKGKKYCINDKDCVPEQCCHPTSCVNINYKPNCTGIMCTMVCQGPIDCGAGSCKCVNNKCQVVSNI